ncbi:MAG: hypothetical protein SOR75_00870 [Synergistes jonesii]|uniref:hypothetical protein n=1 Tax=Synergistes jonesii TaxID=2754 RepID=UPI002A75B777|nr:hypothetical protein [Synergistes jonesii]MDY2983867.1 hypothetical protein [Synergistes jonesii]
MTTNIVRRTERGGTSSQAAASVLMENELGVLTDVKKLIVGDGNKAGGYTLTPDNVVAVWPDQAEASSPLSLAWWINRADGSAVKLRLPAGTYNVLNDLTVPANVYLEIDNGAVFNVAAGKTLTMNCEVGADVQPLFSGSGTMVENYIRRLHINENLISHRQHLWRDGAMMGADGSIDATEPMRIAYIHSDYFEIEGGEKYTFRAHGPCRGFLVFFDADKQYVGVRAPSTATQQRRQGYTFTAPENAAYFVVSSCIRDSDDSLVRSTLNDLGWKHLYKLERGAVATSFSMSKRDLQDAYIRPNERPKNNPEAARQLVSCAESYLGKEWVYGQEPSKQDTLTPEGPPASALLNNGVKQIDCQTLMVLALNGIPYFQSKYFNSAFPWRSVKYYGWGKHPNHLYIEGLSRWCYENGWEIEPGVNYANLQTGDLVFWMALNPNSPFRRHFRGIDHVEMYTGRWVPDPERNNELHPQTIGVALTDPVVRNNFLDRDKDAGNSTARSPKFISMFARVPLESPFTEYNSAHTTNNVIYSSYYKPSLMAIGNGAPLNIDVYGRNYAVWEIGNILPETGEKISAANRIRCGFVPLGCNFKNLSALTEAGFINVAYYYYSADFSYLGHDVGTGASYVIITFKKADDSSVTNADFAVFNRITAIQPYNRNTMTNNKYPPGFHSYAYLETVIPNGARLDRRNGKYAYTTDGITWTELPQADQDKLMSLRIGDGENNIYIPNGQHVRLMRRAMD